MELVKLNNQIKLSKKAYATLDKALSSKKLSDLEKDGVFQRFEYNIELLRKTCRLFLLYKWVHFSPNPKDIFKETYKLWIIQDLELFYSFLDARNLMSHMYSEYMSKELFDMVQKNYKEIWNVLNSLEKAVK